MFRLLFYDFRALIFTSNYFNDQFRNAREMRNGMSEYDERIDAINYYLITRKHCILLVRRCSFTLQHSC